MLYLRASIRDGEMAFTLYGAGADGMPPVTFATIAEVATAVSAIAIRIEPHSAIRMLFDYREAISDPEARRLIEQAIALVESGGVTGSSAAQVPVCATAPRAVAAISDKEMNRPRHGV
jgi:hypothetical protein